MIGRARYDVEAEIEFTCNVSEVRRIKEDKNRMKEPSTW